jgi:hypothetical protein
VLLSPGVLFISSALADRLVINAVKAAAMANGDRSRDASQQIRRIPPNIAAQSRRRSNEGENP